MAPDEFWTVHIDMIPLDGPATVTRLEGHVTYTGASSRAVAVGDEVSFELRHSQVDLDDAALCRATVIRLVDLG